MIRTRQSLETDPHSPHSTTLPPSPEAKALYKELVKRLHPDLARTDSDRDRREAWMKRLTRAWADRDYEELHRLDEECRNASDEPGSTFMDEGSRLVLLLRHIAILRRRLHQLNQQLQQLHTSTLGTLYFQAQEHSEDGRDFLQERARELTEVIEAKEREAFSLRGRIQDKAGKGPGSVN